MTDYANLDYPNNLPLKLELIRLIDLLNANKIHYWVDFASLAKITSSPNNKYLYYLTGFDLCVFENSYKRVNELLNTNNFRVWNSSDVVTNVANPDLPILRTFEEKFSNKEIVIQSMVKWILIWNFKFENDNKVSLRIDKDFSYDKSIFLDVREVEYCGIKMNIPRNVELLNSIRHPNREELVWSHSPRKRENCEKSFGFCNLGDYK
jgi:hypothetical protein